MAEVTLEKDRFIVRTQFFENERAKGIPDKKWDKVAKHWVAPFSQGNAIYIDREFTDREKSPEAEAKLNDLKAVAKAQAETRFPAWFKFMNPPMEIQTKALNKAWGYDEFAFFMGMGTGKTFTAINLSSAYVMDGKIDRVAVFCPTPIKKVWEREYEKHCPLDHKVFIMKSGLNKKAYEFMDEDFNGVKVMVFGIEGMSQGKAHEVAETFVMGKKCMAIIDESSRIKNHAATRTKKIISIGGFAEVRLILTGTPITQGIQDVYGQFRFLNWNIIGHKSFLTFRNRYCIMGGFEGRAIIGYQNVGELMGLLEPYTFTATKEDAMDLPDKVYQTRYIAPSPNQLKAIKELESDMETAIDDKFLEVETVLERMTRYQQIAGGNFPFKEEDEYTTMPISGKNPKIEEMMNVIDEMSGKIIIWARFVPELNAIVERLKKDFGEKSVARFHGLRKGYSEDDRDAEAERFINDETCKFMVSNQTVGGMGQTWVEGHYVIYFSDSFSLEDRLQSEDRCHRKGQVNKVTYVNLVLDHKVDRMIHTAIAKKKDMADYVTEQLKD